MPLLEFKQKASQGLLAKGKIQAKKRGRPLALNSHLDVK